MHLRGRASRAYKEITLQQLRSFCETVRLGSLTAAADSVGLARPTVWKQVHALEEHLGVRLIEPHTRGCRATEAGRLLAEMAGPLVTGFGSLEQGLRDRGVARGAPLVVAASSRMLVEDMPPCVAECERRAPHIRLILNETRAEHVGAAVASMKADLGFAAIEPDPDDPWLTFEPCYELDIVLVTPPDHPLARRRRPIRAADLAEFPLVNSPASFANEAVNRALERLGLFRNRSRRVEAHSAATIRHYVAIGYGIGLVTAAPAHRPDSPLFEVSMARDLGRPTVYAIRRKATLQAEAPGDFIAIVKDVLRTPQPGLGRPGPRDRAPARRGATRR